MIVSMKLLMDTIDHAGQNVKCTGNRAAGRWSAETPFLDH